MHLRKGQGLPSHLMVGGSSPSFSSTGGRVSFPQHLCSSVVPLRRFLAARPRAPGWGGILSVPEWVWSRQPHEDVFPLRTLWTWARSGGQRLRGDSRTRGSSGSDSTGAHFTCYLQRAFEFGCCSLCEVPVCCQHLGFSLESGFRTPVPHLEWGVENF
ncbi:hypothetical protein GW7_18578 [Heterocephalus glaber]|uniref:Uncharacterized protein n=1 Tax=Heterocephalus glaber TaxID=10181 RepID=G5C9S9_HETGA|nr:hypothetical protein GW7_18578 [Heterocephalus glaber]